MSLRVVFMGTPDFASASLKALLDADFEVAAVFTQPDKPRDRGMKPAWSPVKELAVERGIDVYQPASMRTQEASETLRTLEPDVLAVVAYGKILPDEVLAIPRLGSVNVHGSLLPKYRGAAPINWAVINGERESGVTIMYMEKGLDTGDMLLAVRTPIADDDTAGTLHDRLAALGADALVHALALLEAGRITPVKQDDSLHTYAPMLSRDDCRLDFRQSAKQVRDRIRGLAPFPGAFMTLDGRQIKVYEAQFAPGVGEPGRVLYADKERGLVVACADGALRLDTLQPQGKRRMAAKEYLAGHPVLPGAAAE